MNEVFFLPQNHYNLRSLNVFARDKPRTKFLLNSTVYRANQLLQTLLSEVKDCPSLQLFKKKSKLGAMIGVNVKFAQRALPHMAKFYCYCYYFCCYCYFYRINIALQFSYFLMKIYVKDLFITNITIV